ncbi:hypothetical protein PL321_12790 [Caloramator sp. mosi_1]|uniref:hypothetical protein n=1 Tax=Caloramator sp. mosi_1 TaxID=3023090 RepID=UPI00236073C3|nr:hypothetical protein [Caloramator sp. mosi_1]WDC83556.1 hypothetical protein PL321_12790 [Caloramator sp. mosi_1]
MKKEDLGVIKIALSYLLFGTLWVVFSDNLIFRSIKYKDSHLNYSIIKGIIFVVLSTFLIFILVKERLIKE